MPQHYHISITKDTKKDLKTWWSLLLDIKTHTKIPHFLFKTANKLELYNNATMKPGLGFGCFFQGEWSFGIWPTHFIRGKSSIALLEVVPIIISIVICAPRLANQQIINWDNKAVVIMTNSHPGASTV